jgi:hypothetical protein
MHINNARQRTLLTTHIKYRQRATHDNTQHICHSQGVVLQPSVTVVSNVVVGGLRTVQVTRGLAGATAQHYSFDANSRGVAVISAVGDGESVC